MEPSKLGRRACRSRPQILRSATWAMDTAGRMEGVAGEGIPQPCLPTTEEPLYASWGEGVAARIAAKPSWQASACLKSRDTSNGSAQSAGCQPWRGKETPTIHKSTVCNAQTHKTQNNYTAQRCQTDPMTKVERKGRSPKLERPELRVNRCCRLHVWRLQFLHRQLPFDAREVWQPSQATKRAMPQGTANGGPHRKNMDE